MKYNKANVEVVKFDDSVEFLVLSSNIPGVGQCGSVTTLDKAGVIAAAGDGHSGPCSGFMYDSGRTYYGCNPFSFEGYSAQIDCAVVSVTPGGMNNCSVVSRLP